MMGVWHMAALAGLATAVPRNIMMPTSLDIQKDYSIRNVAATIARDAMTYYKGNTSSATSVAVGDLSDPYYWWVAGALWGGMLDYYHYTEDASYNDEVLQALTSPHNLGPNFDYVPPEHASEEGNDDLYFWGSAALAAAERNFPQPDESIPSWLDIGANVFESLRSRWNTTACRGGGLAWQIYPDNPNGMDYRNSITNGGFFQIASRLARATSNATYADWAAKVWDWSWDVGFIDHDSWHVWDGAGADQDCSQLSRSSYTYTSGVYLYGAAVMANHTAGDAGATDDRGSNVWAVRAARLLDGAEWFFGPYPNATDIMYEGACEPDNSCNADMETHKAYLARNMWQASVMLPDLKPKVHRLLGTSAKAAAATCTGGDSGTACGMKWYTGAYDGHVGLGPQMTALETIQGLLADKAEPPLRGDDIHTVRHVNWAAVDPYRTGN
ncbi:mannan endo-1,6-alpha-mannosidase [Geosmithia morbida]|uniref:Mannan endo-1,6-alpha-mannosidase n=1 Tax=Geosmithia morbida TaxID=1094350 RepID=A0A9P4Z360_9HYPO|nr:mannan endo-1,6-alpha-mannosidase [Geosmithia morbida]KAF4126850.1 mannan endo-1,6-alpha-mannosidase [Geosmithia morbida]